MIWIAGLCAVCLVICLPLFMHYKKTTHLLLAASYKSLGTLCSLVLALTAAIRLDPRCYILVAAIALYAAADFILEYEFLLGAGFFLFGHICSIAYFLGLSPLSPFHFISLLLLGGTIALVMYRWRKPIGKQMPAFIIYGISLVSMSACAVSCFSAGTSGILIACGGALFCFSDFLLLRRLLFPSSPLLHWAVMITYYSSVLLFGSASLLL